MDRKNVWKNYTDEQLKELERINEDYKRCLDLGKTERECVALTVERLRDSGYVSLRSEEHTSELQSQR